MSRSQRHQQNKSRQGSWKGFLIGGILLLVCLGTFLQMRGQDGPQGVCGAKAAKPFMAATVVVVPSQAWMLTLVNEANPLPADFTIETGKLANGKLFDARAIGDLQAMLDAAAADGVNIFVTSSYRTIDYQQGLFNRKINQYKAQGYDDAQAYAIAKTIVAVPGTSEHNLGLAADIITPSYTVLDEGFENTAAFQWLSAHCAEYGFILRYPKDKQDITGIIYEPWHYRYVGRDAAQTIMARGQCLEEYLGRV